MYMYDVCVVTVLLSMNEHEKQICGIYNGTYGHKNQNFVIELLPIHDSH
jgi:hypothetical protein